MSIRKTIHHVGGGLKWTYNRHLGLAFLVSVGLHAGIIGAYMLSLDEDRTSPTIINLQPLPSPADTLSMPIVLSNFKMGGGGGSPDVKAPDGLAKKGQPDAAPKFEPNKRPQEADFIPKNPPRVRPVTTPPKQEPRLTTTDRDTVKKSTTGAGIAGQHPKGRGTKNAGGNGGEGIGSGIGVGIGPGEGMGGRGWLRPPSRSPKGITSEGVVKVRFTVLPNGDVVNVVPITRSADPALIKDAIRRMLNAKAQPLSETAQQSPQTVTQTFTFKVN